ncbi:hypothetical protein K0M31_005592 [Melipona bicolor]|uniref:Uncharacterized protein n=1 Tax=Melipona bicolor TaxID=60889 RepID=A0AA40KM13_9HYME|nr:hypothetical protein K0M31_005592 [Melipona bicolor]
MFLEPDSRSHDKFSDESQKLFNKYSCVQNSNRSNSFYRPLAGQQRASQLQPVEDNSEQDKMIRETEFGLVVSANSAGGLFILVDTVRAGSVSGSASASTYADPATGLELDSTATEFPLCSPVLGKDYRNLFVRTLQRTTGTLLVF